MSEQVAYRTIVADPPWSFGDSLPGKGRGAAKHYTCMHLHDVCDYPLPPLADDCRLFLWRVAAMQEEAMLVINEWHFTLKAEAVWLKTTSTGKLSFGMGRTVRNCHETCLIATRGKSEVLSRSVRSVFYAPLGKHSAKPDAFYEMVEALSPGPYVELFARRHRPGWTCLGDELEEVA